MKQFRNEFGEVVEALDEFDLYGAVERDQLIELVETAEESALAELAAFGYVEFENDERDIVGDELEGFWEFACDLADEPKPHGWVLDELY